MKLATPFQLMLKSRKRGSTDPLPHTSSWHTAYLVKHRDNFIYFTFMKCCADSHIKSSYDLLILRMAVDLLGDFAADQNLFKATVEEF
jgi:hypothetical protein